MSKRLDGLDIIRTLAVFFVISVHFFLYTGYYEKPFYGSFIYFQTFFRWLFFCSVPLFIILTGYLKINKKIDKSHYKSIIHILISYLFASICVILVTKLYLNKDASLISLVTGIFNFKTDKYAWYIEMYIGLFLLIPFLNVLWHGLDKKNKKILILSLILLTSISPILKSFSLDIVPDWWQGFYPITYYFIGAYIKEYPIKISKIKNILLILLLLVIQTSLFYYLNYSRLFDWQIFGTYGNLFTLLISTLIFILFYDINFKKEKIKIIFKDISILSLDIFLLSYITDNIVYDVLKNLFDYKTLSLMFIIIVPLLFIFNYLLAHIEKLILKFLSYLKNKIKNYFVRRDEVCNHS